MGSWNDTLLSQRMGLSGTQKNVYQKSNCCCFVMSSCSSSSSALSLDPTDASLCTPLLLETKSDAHAAAITAFFNLPTRILIGTKKLSFPISPVHMLYHCALWQKAVEGGDEPKALLTETCVEPTDVEFQRAWMKANGFDDNLGPLGDSGERYLDYLGYKTTTTSKLAGDIRRALADMKSVYEERKGVFEGQEEALRAIKAYTKHLKTSRYLHFTYEVDISPQGVMALQDIGFTVNQNGFCKNKIEWVPPRRNAATKRPRPE